MSELLMLSPHFSLGEMTRTQVRGAVNAPGPLELERLRVLCENILEPVRAEFGPVAVSSGFRAAHVNRAVGGSAKSQHCKGEAADFEPIHRPDHLAVVRWIAEHLVFDQAIIEFCSCDKSSPHACPGWVHCSYVDWRENRRQILRARHQPLIGVSYQTLTPDRIPASLEDHRATPKP